MIVRVSITNRVFENNKPAYYRWLLQVESKVILHLNLNNKLTTIVVHKGKDPQGMQQTQKEWTNSDLDISN